jgi:hypothetical protein
VHEEYCSLLHCWQLKSQDFLREQICNAATVDETLRERQEHGQYKTEVCSDQNQVLGAQEVKKHGRAQASDRATPPHFLTACLPEMSAIPGKSLTIEEISPLENEAAALSSAVV